MNSMLQLSPMARAIEPTMIRSLRSTMTASTIDFGLGQTDLEVTEGVRRHFQEYADGPIRTPYTPNAGSDEARQAVADHVGCAPEEVMLTCGVQQGLAVAIFGLCEPGDEVLIPDPGFPAYANLVRAAGARPVTYRLRAPTKDEPGWGLDCRRLVEKLGDDTRLVVFNNPANPTGSVYDETNLARVIDVLGEQGVGWISDEIYEDYVWQGQFVSARRVGGDSEGGVVLSGLSKSHHMMGWRLGWMVASAETIGALTPLHQHMVTCAPRPAQEAAIAALGEHDEAVEKTRRIFAERRKTVLEAVESVPFETPPVAAGAFYLFLDVRPWLETFSTTLELAEALLDEEDVLAIPGEGFGAAGLGHLRIAYTIGGDALKNGLHRLCRFLRRHQHHGEGS